jgi:voltage-gated sodium channel
LPREDAAQKGIARIDSLQDLLDQQLAAVERTLAFNRAIAHRLAFSSRIHHRRLSASTASDPEQVIDPTNDEASDIATPLVTRVPAITPSSQQGVAFGLLADAPTPIPSRTENGLSIGDTIARCQALLQLKPGELATPLLGSWHTNNATGSTGEALAQGPPSPSSSVASWSSAKQYQKGIENLPADDKAGKARHSELQAHDSEQPDIKRFASTGYASTGYASTLPEGTSRRVLNLFPKVQGIKEAIIAQLGETHYDIDALYETNGICSLLAKSSVFNNISLSVIAMNTIWIAVDTDYNHAEILCNAKPLFQIVENMFCTFFVLEMAVRVIAFKNKRDAFRDGWLVFDLTLVSSMVWETWIIVLWYKFIGNVQTGGRASSILRIFRVFRLTRVARTARLVGNIPELLILCKGMSVAVRSVAAVLCLLGLVIYVFSILLTDLVGSAPNPTLSGNFDSVLDSMHTLLIQVVSGFDADLMKSLYHADFTVYLVFLVYFLVASLTVMNMLIGILCDVVANVAGDERESSFVQKVEGLVSKLMQDLDTDGSKTLSKEEFDGIIYNQDMMRVLYDQGVDVVGIVDFGSFLFQETEELSFADFLSLVIQFRESKPATMKDVMDLRKYLARELACLEARLTTNLGILAEEAI